MYSIERIEVQEIEHFLICFVLFWYWESNLEPCPCHAGLVPLSYIPVLKLSMFMRKELGSAYRRPRQEKTVETSRAEAVKEPASA